MHSGDPGGVSMSPDHASDELTPGVMVGEYRVEGTLGQGGMATVYAAVHPLIGKRAAIKVVNRHLLSDAAAVERFVQEAQAVNRIGHPNIVDVFSIGTLPDGRPYFVMEWLQGESLAARLERGRLTLDEAADVLSQLCLALEAVHEVGIVHRDLKPDNIFLVPVRGQSTPAVKLLDFGVAKLRHRDGMNRVTRTGMAVGTPAYVSPEQARGLDIDHRSDIYSLGVIAYELVTGTLPFDAPSALDLMMMHVQVPAPPLRGACPDAPRILDDLVATMLAKTTDARPSLADIRAALATLASDPYPAGRRTAPLAAPVRTSAALAATISTEHLDDRRRSMLGPIVGLLLASGAIVLAVVMYLRERSDAPAATRAEPVAIPAVVVPAVDASILATEAPPDAATPAPDAKLVLRMSTRGARVELDGVPIDDARDGRELTLARPGQHVITATARGYKPLRTTIDVAVGAAAEVTVALEPIARPKVQRTRPPAAHRGENYTLDPF